jgi:ubiquinone/menaquinone biosynthesis C-methylase UbiE
MASMSRGPARGDSYRRIAGFYDRLFESTNRGLRLIGMHVARPAAGMCVLDVGCGTGTQLELYQRHACRLHGLDASPAMLEVARKRLGAEAWLELGDAQSMPFADRTFDLVMSTLTLHGMSSEERTGMLREVRRVLKEGGRTLFIDFHPGPYRPIEGWLSRSMVVIVEFMAGREHFQNHRQFMREGGLPGVASGHGLHIDKQFVLGGGAFAVQYARSD